MSNTVQNLYKDYLELIEKHSQHMPAYAVNYNLIKLAVKQLLDESPRHRIALETIKLATEDGIKCHVESVKKKS